MARRYGTFTAARRTALRKAQAASAAKRRGHGKSKSTKTRRYAKRAAKTAGVLGAVGGAAYIAHKGTGGQVIRSTRTPTVYRSTTHVAGAPLKFDSAGFRVGTGRKVTTQGKAIGKPGIKVTRMGKTVNIMHRNAKGDRHFGYAYGVNGPFGKKISGHPTKVTSYKPPRARIHVKAFRQANFPHTQETLNITKRKSGKMYMYPHPNSEPIHTGKASGIRKTRISEAEAMRRTRSYVDIRTVSGKKVSSAERTKALGKYRNTKAKGSRAGQKTLVKKLGLRYIDAGS